MGLRFESFVIVNQDGNHFQGRTVDGKVREFELCFNRDLATNELSVGVIRHHHDEDGLPWFPGSEPWTADETRGDD